MKVTFKNLKMGLVTALEYFKRKHVFATSRFLWKGRRDRTKIILAQIVPLRRCNLACDYCNEYDDHSRHVPLEDVKTWIDKLAELGTLNITLSGGEPMLHPNVYEIVSYIRSKGIMAALITNGYSLTEKNIKKLNKAGLQDLQISVDNVEPDEVSQKSLSYYEGKGVPMLLKRYAKFNVNFNSVVGGGVKKAEDALTITERARELGFSSTVGIIHDENGLLKGLTKEEKIIYEKIKSISAQTLSFAKLSKFQDELVDSGTSSWSCRAGSRYVYVCEHGHVQWCSQHRACKDGKPHGDSIVSAAILDIPLSDYTKEDFHREYNTEKWCAETCTIQCVRLVGLFDNDRDPQTQFAEYKTTSNSVLNPKLVNQLRDQD